MEKKRGKTCKICNNIFKNLGAHVRSKHKMSLAEYDDYIVNSHKMDIEPKGNTKTTGKELEERIWGKQERDVNRPLKEFLDEFNITEEELRSVARQFKTGTRIDVKTDAKNKHEIGLKGALELKGETHVETFNAVTAEILKTEYGFIELQSKGGPPKSWVLERKL